MRSSLTRCAALLSGLLAASTLATVHCGSSEGETPPPSTSTTSADGTYSGAMVGVDFAASVKLTIPAGTTTPASLKPQAVGPVTVTGTIQSAALGVPVTLTGTFDPLTLTVTFSGSSPRGELKFRGKLENGILTGEAEGPYGAVPLVLVKDILGVRVFCGEVEGATRGLLGVFTAGDRAGAVYAVDGQRDAILGVARASSVDVQGRGAKIAGDVSGATLNGTFTAPSGASGRFAANEGRCATLIAGALDGGTDAGVDAGPPKTPETIYTSAAPGIGHMTLSAGTLYFSIAHPYFSEKMELWKVGTDGKNAAEVLPVNDPGAVKRLNPSGLAVVGTTLFVSGGTNPPGGGASLFSVPTSGGSLTSLGDIGQAPDFALYANVTADSAGVYRTDCAIPATVRGFSLAGAPGGTLSNLVGACAITSDGTNVFVAGGQLTGVVRVPNALATANQSPATVASADDYKINGFYPSMQAIAVDATHVYFAGANNADKKGGVWRRPKDGSGATQTLAITDKLLRGAIAVDDAFVYFFNVESAGQAGGPSNLFRIAKTAVNGTPELIGPGNAGSIVTDGTYVYWASGAKIQRVGR
ncbi:MAG: hypothetical protein JST00_47810 [Deltaproteobacteria bacterium]|nr:hypothetical protein [Deltaproteobacteria bacterium]